MASTRRNNPTCLKFVGCPVGVLRVSGECLEGVWMVSGECLGGVGRVSGSCLEAVWMVSGGYTYMGCPLDRCKGKVRTG